jgi:polar amino acid transport system substrate-binding protein
MLYAMLVSLVLSLALIGSDLAPTGTLRAAFIADNPVQGRVDPQTGAITGPAADLVEELARRLGVGSTIVPVADAAAVIDYVTTKKADIGFLAYEAARAAQVEFSIPYALVGSTFLVPIDSTFQSSSDVDRINVRVGAVRGQSQEVWVSANLKKAFIERQRTMPPDEEVARLVVSGQVDAFAANRQRLVTIARTYPTVRVLADNFLTIGQAIVVDKGSPALAEVNRFLDDARASGFVKTSLERAQLIGVEVAQSPSPRR